MEGLQRALFKFHYMREHPKTIWSPHFLKMFGKIQIEGQSAGNLLEIIGPSETTRETLSIINYNSLNIN
jgi:hypothetical protein